MALTAVIIVIIIIFVLFSYFVCCSGKDDEEKRQNEGNRQAAVITTTSYPTTAGYVGATNSPYPTQPLHHNTNVGSARPPQLGFTTGPNTGYPPVGQAPSMPMPYQTQPYPHTHPAPNSAPYPPISSPYPPPTTAPYPTGGVPHQSVRADVYNTSSVNPSGAPSAPARIDDCQPPSYFEAVGQQIPTTTMSDKQLPYNPHY